MKITPFIIDRFAKFVFGGVPFESMKRISADWNNVEISGANKRVMVISEFQTLGYEIASWLVNLGLELAVSWLKSKSSK